MATVFGLLVSAALSLYCIVRELRKWEGDMSTLPRNRYLRSFQKQVVCERFLQGTRKQQFLKANRGQWTTLLEENDNGVSKSH